MATAKKNEVQRMRHFDVDAVKRYMVDGVGFIFLKKKKHPPQGLFETVRTQFKHIVDVVLEKQIFVSQQQSNYSALAQTIPLEQCIMLLNVYQLAIDDYVAEFERMNDKHNELIQLEKKYRILPAEIAFVHEQVLAIEKIRHNIHYHHERYRQLLTALEIKFQTAYVPFVQNNITTKISLPHLNIHLLEELVKRLNTFKFKIEKDVYEYRELLIHETSGIMTEFEIERLRKIENRITKNIILFKQQFAHLEQLMTTTELHVLFDKRHHHTVRQLKRFHRKVKKTDFTVHGHLGHLARTKPLKTNSRQTIKKRLSRTRNTLRLKLAVLKRKKI